MGDLGPPAERATAVSRRPVLIALMVTIGLAALDNTIVSTAIPSIVRGLGGFSEFPWVFSIYLLTQAVTVPIYGRLADVFGRKPVIFVGIGIFLLGSALSGAAWNMPSLIVFRGLQGVGAGAVQPVAMTIVGDLYTVEERGRIQGFLSGVWGVAAVVGPALGGTLSQYATWRWIFYLNLPVGAVAAMMLARHLHEHVVRHSHRIDYAGAITLMGGMTLLILGLLQGDVHWAWTSPAELVVLAAAVVLVLAFVEIERRAPEPFMPPWLFKSRTLIAGNLAGLAIGALLIGLTSYVPTFSQGVIGVGPVLAGFALAGESVTWVLGSVISGRLYGHTGFRFTALIGAGICLIGAIMFAFLRASVSLGLVAVAGSIIGLGFGFVATSVIVAVQSTVGWERRGVVTGANMFGRTIGGALGVAVFGSIANSTLVGWLRSPPAAIASHLPHGANAAALILGGSSAIHDHAASSFVREGLFLAVHHVFVGLVVIALALAIAVAAIPRRVVALTFDRPRADDDPIPTSSPAGKEA
jgi:EmrB/QacA subfamily drug resistance transporter